MNLKLRFAIFVTCLVAIILLISSISIFFLFKSYRSDDHYARLRNRAETLLNEYKTVASDTALVTSKSFTSSLHNLQMILIKPPHDIVFKESDSINLNISDSLLDNIRLHKELQFTQGNYECVGVYDNDIQLYAICGAVDKTGLSKLRYLFYILAGVFGGGILVSVLLSFLMVQQAFKPLIRLGRQMQLTTSTNMTAKIDEGKGKNELEQIAVNFNAMLERLNQSFEVQKSFVQHASHELRTPLATMLSQTEAALNRELTSTEYKRTLQSLQEEQIGLIDLTNSLLVLSQYENINSRNNWQTQRIDEILYDSIMECKRLFNDIDIDLSFESEPSDEAELTLNGNEVLLKSAFRNLIKNGYLYSNDKKVRILIKTSFDTLTVSFVNKGQVLTQSDINKMFIPFYRGSNASLTKGFGVGLSIIKRIADIHKANLAYTAIEPDTNKFAISFQLKPMANNQNNIPVATGLLYN
jgi:signal transduction histidine kinase